MWAGRPVGAGEEPQGLTSPHKFHTWEVLAYPGADNSRSHHQQPSRQLIPTLVSHFQVLAFPGVDHTRTISNHLVEIIEVLCIEAVRSALLKVRGTRLQQRKQPPLWRRVPARPCWPIPFRVCARLASPSGAA